MVFNKNLSSSVDFLGIGKPSHPVTRRIAIKLNTILLFIFYFHDSYTPLSIARGIKKSVLLVKKTDWN